MSRTAVVQGHSVWFVEARVVLRYKGGIPGSEGTGEFMGRMVEWKMSGDRLGTASGGVARARVFGVQSAMRRGVAHGSRWLC